MKEQVGEDEAGGEMEVAGRGEVVMVLGVERMEVEVALVELHLGIAAGHWETEIVEGAWEA